VPKYFGKSLAKFQWIIKMHRVRDDGLEQDMAEISCRLGRELHCRASLSTVSQCQAMRETQIRNCLAAGKGLLSGNGRSW
jgi:hypothetical protein